MGGRKRSGGEKRKREEEEERNEEGKERGGGGEQEKGIGREVRGKQKQQQKGKPEGALNLPHHISKHTPWPLSGHFLKEFFREFLVCFRVL